MRRSKSSLACRRLPRNDVEPADREGGGQEDPGDVGSGAADQRHHQGAQSDGAGLGQRGGGEGSLDLVGDGARLYLPVVAPDHLAGYPADRVQQRLAVVVEAGAHVADHPFPVAGELTPLDVPADVLPQLQISLDDPVDDPPHLILDLARCLADDLPLEGALYPLAVHQALDPADPDGLLEEPHAAPFHVAEQDIQPGQPGLEVPQHLLVEERQLLVDVLNRLDVLGQQLEPLERGVLVLRREAQPDVQRVEQLEPDPFLLVEGVEQVILHRTEPALLPQLLTGTVRLSACPSPSCPARLQRLPGRNGEDLWRLAQEAGGVFPHVADAPRRAPPAG